MILCLLPRQPETWQVGPKGRDARKAVQCYQGQGRRWDAAWRDAAMLQLSEAEQNDKTSSSASWIVVRILSSNPPHVSTTPLSILASNVQSCVPRPWVYAWNKGTPLKFVLNFCLMELCKHCEALRLQLSGIFRLSWILTLCSLLSVGSDIVNIWKQEQCSVLWLGWSIQEILRRCLHHATTAFKARQIKNQFEINNCQCSIKFWKWTYL